MDDDNKSTVEFAEMLTRGDFGEFFYYPNHDDTIEKVWKDEENRKFLDKVLSSSETSGKAKFLVCEVFFKKDISFMERHKPETVAEIYAEALKNDYIEFANPWGLLYEDEEGSVGIKFLTLERAEVIKMRFFLQD